MGCAGSKKGSVDITADGGTGGHSSLGRGLSRHRYYSLHANSSNLNNTRDANEPQPAPTVEEARSDDEKQVLHVLGVNFNIPENAKNHHTERYEITEERLEDFQKHPALLVVRRGQPFDITISFDRTFDKVKDDLKLIFDAGTRPKESKGTRIVIILSDVDKPKEWGAKILKQEGYDVTVRIFTPPNAIVAKWQFKFDTIIRKGDVCKVFRYTHQHPLYLLFNPWCPDDQVYLDDEASREEYVLNDKGRIYRGTTKQISAKPWNFGQFEDFMLECVMELLEISELSYRVRGNPVNVCRKISAVTNAPDDGGVLVGNWSGDYAGGTSPLAWVGSVAILEQYYRTKKPVQFGQCWVFSGVVTTLCRCLGMPARSVTNFASAHDCDGSITIDDHWTPEGKPLSELNSDSVWNFHVWNDVWMARPDLPSGFGGWQAIDATPQETSDGIYCAGPASLESLKNGLVHLPYDGPFIFAEVNADRIHWIQLPDGEWTNAKQEHSVGKFVSTKTPANNARMDVTYMYKFPEGSQQERTAVWRAAKEGSSRQDIYQIKIEDMKFDLMEKEAVMIGQPFDVTLKVTNNATVKRNVRVTLTATVVYYTGVPVTVIKSEPYIARIDSGSAGEVAMKVEVKDYLDKLVDMCNFKISCMVRVEETNQFHCESDDFRLIKPDLVVTVPESVTVGEEYEAAISFTNPLNRALTKCEFTVEGAGLQKPLRIKANTVGPHAEGKTSLRLTAKRPGEREVVASFDSKELADLSGSAIIHVNAKPT